MVRLALFRRGPGMPSTGGRLYSVVAKLPGFCSVRAPSTCGPWRRRLALLAAAGVGGCARDFDRRDRAAGDVGLDLYYWNMERNGRPTRVKASRIATQRAEERFRTVAAPLMAN
jgi:hypothetical protein